MTALENPFSSYRANDADDFRQSWDIASHGSRATESIETAIGQIKKSPEPNSYRKIVVVKSNSGYGKTHLFANQAPMCGRRPPGLRADDR